MTTHRLQIAESNGKTYGGYLALPPAGSGPGLLLLPEVYGVNDDIKAAAHRYAAAGFVVLAPDLLWRKAPDLVFAYADREQAREVLLGLGGVDAFVEHIAPALDALRKVPQFDGSKLLVLGYGFGSRLAFAAIGARLISVDAGIGFFGATPDHLPLIAPIHKPWQFHFAENDYGVPIDVYHQYRKALGARTDVEIHLYPAAQHGFAIPGRKEFDRASAETAYHRSLDFLGRVLGRELAA
jgi:carboxymethylenebutenolidase